MSLADQIRQTVYRDYVRPELEAGRTEITVRAGDVHKHMQLDNRLPAICGALRSKQFVTEYKLELIDRSGPSNGANAIFVFRLGGGHGVLAQNVETSIRQQPKVEEPKARRAVSPGADTMFLVSCVGRKCSTPVQAKDLYVSDWFTKARRYVETTGCSWFILSAEYGLVHPDQVLAPYERTLNDMRVKERREWADKIISQMRECVPNHMRVIFLAGERYREFLMEQLWRQGLRVEIPMEGLRIGEQLAWLTKHTPHESTR